MHKKQRNQRIQRNQNNQKNQTNRTNQNHQKMGTTENRQNINRKSTEIKQKHNKNIRTNFKKIIRRRSFPNSFLIDLLIYQNNRINPTNKFQLMSFSMDNFFYDHFFFTLENKTKRNEPGLELSLVIQAFGR